MNCTVKQLAERHPYLTVSAIRWLLFNRHENGLSTAVTKLGKRVLIDDEKFAEWVAAHRDCASEATKSTPSQPMKEAPKVVVDFIREKTSQSSIRQVGLKTGLNQSAIWRLVQGFTEPTDDSLQKIADAYGVEIVIRITPQQEKTYEIWEIIQP